MQDGHSYRLYAQVTGGPLYLQSHEVREEEITSEDHV